MKAYYTSNNAYDTIVVVDDSGELSASLTVTPKVFADFLAEYPDFHVWGSAIEHDDPSDPAHYGDVLAERQDAGPVVVHDPDAFDRRKQFHGLLDY